MDVAERVLTKGQQVVPLTPKAFDTLVVLVRNSGHVVEKDELLKQVWPDTFVEEGVLAVNVAAIRKALSDGEEGTFLHRDRAAAGISVHRGGASTRETARG